MFVKNFKASNINKGAEMKILIVARHYYSA